MQGVIRYLAPSLFGALLILNLAPPPRSAAQEPATNAASRVTVRYEAGAFELVSLSDLDKVLSPSVALPAGAGPVGGAWFELRSETDEIIYRRLVEHPARLVFEDAGGDAPPARVQAPTDTRVFAVLIPRAMPGDQLVFFGSPSLPGAEGQAAQELGRIVLIPGGA